MILRMLSSESGISPIAHLSAYPLAYVSEQTNLACLKLYKKFNQLDRTAASKFLQNARVVDSH